MFAKDVQQEPVLALDGGVDGATYYRLIVENIQTYLKPKGFCFFEIHERQGAMIQEMFQNHDSLWKTRILPDYTGVDRIFEAQQVVSHG